MARNKNKTLNAKLVARNSIWQICYTKNGMTNYLSTRTTDKREAELQLSIFIQESLKQKKYSPIPTIGEILNDYLKNKIDKNEPLDGVKYQIKRLNAFFGQHVVAAINKDLLNQYKIERKVQDSSIRRDFVILKSALNFAHMEGIISSVPNIELPKNNPPREYWITKEEAKKLIDAAKVNGENDYNHLVVFISLLIGTLGLKSALLDLTWDRVDFNTGLITLANPNKKQTKKRRATVPMTDNLRKVLLAAKQIALSDYVVEYHGKKVDNIQKAFHNCAIRAGLPKVTPHVLRHSGATWLAMDGVDIYDIATYLGHSDIKTTYNTYAKYDPKYLGKAANCLNHVLI